MSGKIPDIEALARQFGKTPEAVRRAIAPIMEDLLAFCQSDGSDESITRFKETDAGKSFMDALGRMDGMPYCPCGYRITECSSSGAVRCRFCGRLQRR